MQKANLKKNLRKPQHQSRAGIESKMTSLPDILPVRQPVMGKLENQVTFISGGDSGIGKAVALLYAKEGADITIDYLNELNDAKQVKKEIEERYNRKCLQVAGDTSNERSCISAVKKVVKQFNKIDILINNAANHCERKSLLDISTAHLLKTFSTKTFSMFWITKAVLPHLTKSSSIINTSSVTAYRGSADLIDYAVTRGAIVSFTRSLSGSLVDKGIGVNAVAPGPI